MLQEERKIKLVETGGLDEEEMKYRSAKEQEEKKRKEEDQKLAHFKFKKYKKIRSQQKRVTNTEDAKKNGNYCHCIPRNQWNAATFQNLEMVADPEVTEKGSEYQTPSSHRSTTRTPFELTSLPSL